MRAVVHIRRAVGERCEIAPFHDDRGRPWPSAHGDVLDRQPESREDAKQPLEPGANGRTGVAHPAERMIAGEDVLEPRRQAGDHVVDITTVERLEKPDDVAADHGVIHRTSPLAATI